MPVHLKELWVESFFGGGIYRTLGGKGADASALLMLPDTCGGGGQALFPSHADLNLPGTSLSC